MHIHGSVKSDWLQTSGKKKKRGRGCRHGSMEAWSAHDMSTYCTYDNISMKRSWKNPSLFILRLGVAKNISQTRLGLTRNMHTSIVIQYRMGGECLRLLRAGKPQISYDPSYNYLHLVCVRANQLGGSLTSSYPTSTDKTIMELV